jgi:PKD repeat protein
MRQSMQRFVKPLSCWATTRWLAAPWLTAFLALSAHAAPQAHFTATPLQGDPCVAPCAVHFDAIGDGASATVDPAYPREFHTLLFDWNFGQPGGGSWPVSGVDKNQALGAIAGHVYAQPGTYPVTLTVTNPAGETSVAQQLVVVADPNAVFSASDTWCFANSGTPGGPDFAACPTAQASQHVVIGSGTAGGFDMALGASFCDAGNSKGRCLFRSGDTFLANGFLGLAQTAPGPGLISSFGAGARPRIVGGPGFLGLGDGWTVAHFDVALDSTAAPSLPLFLLNPERQRVLVWDVRARGLRALCFESATGNTATVHSDLVGIVELDCLNAGSSDLAGLFLRAERVLVQGNSIDNAYEGQFTLRTVHFPRSIVQHNRIQRPQEDSANQRNAIQIRAWAGDQLSGPPAPPTPSPTEWVIVSDNVISQDNAIMTIRTCQTNTCTDAVSAPDVRDVVFERNFLFLSSGGTGGPGAQLRVFWLQGGDLTVRNNVVDLQGIDPTGPGEIQLVGQDANMASGPGLLDDRVHVLNNVMYFDEPTARAFRFCNSLAAGSGHECRNNLAWLPNQTGLQEADDGSFLSSNNVFGAENPFVGAVPGQGQTSAAHFVPSAQATDVIDSGYDFGNGPSQVPLDFAGECRPADGDQSGGAGWDVGAFEVAADTACRQTTPTTTTTTAPATTTTTTTVAPAPTTTTTTVAPAPTTTTTTVAPATTTTTTTVAPATTTTTTTVAPVTTTTGPTSSTTTTTVPEPSCTAGFGFTSGWFSVNEKSAGREKLKATLVRGPLVTQASFGDPSAVGGTAVALFVYDDTGAQVAALAVDRAGESCGTQPCWKPLGDVPPAGKGFAYKDPAASASGVRSLKLKGGVAGKSSISLSAANRATKGQTALPTGIAAALSDSSSVTLELHTSDGACFSATLFEVVAQEPGIFKAR